MIKRVNRMLTLLLIVAASYAVGRLVFPDLWARF